MHYYVRYYIDYACKNLPIVDDRKSICIKIHGPIADTVATYIGEKKTTRFLLRSGAKIRKIREKKGKKKGGGEKEERKARTLMIT